MKISNYLYHQQSVFVTAHMLFISGWIILCCFGILSTDLFASTAHNIHKAVSEADISTIKKILITKPTCINDLDESGNTPLLIATKLVSDEVQKKKIIQFLLLKGADINGRSIRGDTPLNLAVANNNYDLADFLLKNGADVNIGDYNGWTPLHSAWSDTIAKLLVSYGAQLDAKTNFGRTPLFKAVSVDIFRDIALYLISQGADINAVDKHGNTLLHVAIWNRDMELPKLIIAKGLNINIKNKFNETPLHIVARFQSKKEAEYLIACGADVNARDSEQQTPLHWAAARGNYDVVDLLISKGADANATDTLGHTPLYYALLANDSKGAHILRKSTFKERNELKALVSYEFLSALGSHGAGNLKKARMLLVKYPQYDLANTRNICYMTPLQQRVYEDDIETVEFLLAHGANINEKDRYGSTPLLIAINRPYLQLVDLLIKNGANVNAKDIDGKTPLQEAKQIGNKELVDLLRKHGAKE